MTTGAANRDPSPSESGNGVGEEGPRPDPPTPADAAPETTSGVGPSEPAAHAGPVVTTTDDDPPPADVDAAPSTTPEPVAGPPADRLPPDSPAEVTTTAAPATGGPAGPPPSRQGLPAWAKVAGGVAALALIGGAYWLGQRGGDEPETTSPAPTATTAAEPAESTAPPDDEPPVDAENLTEFEDPETGISLSYPEAWEQLELPGDDPSLRLVVSAGGQDSFLVRVVPLEGGEIATEEDLVDVNALTDAIIADSGARIIQEQPIELGGMGGYYYLYQFTDTESGAEGAHAHYFLFQGATMYVLVFQALPTENFEVLAPAFDIVAESFSVDAPGAGGEDDTATTTTAAPDEGDDDAASTTTAPGG